MKPEVSRSMRRLTVIINYLSIALLLVMIYLGRSNDWSTAVIVSAAALALVMVATFIVLQVRTRLWKLVHTKVDNLDERQVLVTHESLRHSYGIFTVVSLLVLLCIALVGGKHDSMLMLIFASLLYLAHTLPASIIAWTEKEV